MRYSTSILTLACVLLTLSTVIFISSGSSLESDQEGVGEPKRLFERAFDRQHSSRDVPEAASPFDYEDHMSNMKSNSPSTPSSLSVSPQGGFVEPSNIHLGKHVRPVKPLAKHTRRRKENNVALVPRGDQSSDLAINSVKTETSSESPSSGPKVTEEKSKPSTD